MPKPGPTEISTDPAVIGMSTDDKDVELKRIIQQQDDYDKVLVNPLAGLRLDAVSDLGEHFVNDYDLVIEGDERKQAIKLFRIAAVLAQNNDIWRDLSHDSSEKAGLSITAEERMCLQREETKMLDQPIGLYFIIIACALSAAVQGWNE